MPSNSRAVLVNLRYDETLMVFDNAAGAGTAADLYLSNTEAAAARLAASASCTHIAFRTGAGVPLMAAGGGAGVVTVWNLEQRRLHTMVRDAHDAPLVSLHFFPGACLRPLAGPGLAPLATLRAPQPAPCSAPCTALPAAPPPPPKQHRPTPRPRHAPTIHPRRRAAAHVLWARQQPEAVGV